MNKNNVKLKNSFWTFGPCIFFRNLLSLFYLTRLTRGINVFYIWSISSTFLKLIHIYMIGNCNMKTSPFGYLIRTLLWVVKNRLFLSEKSWGKIVDWRIVFEYGWRDSLRDVANIVHSWVHVLLETHQSWICH